MSSANPEPNRLLIQARERLESPAQPGETMSRAELAGEVSKILFPDPRRRVTSPFNANYVGKLENGVINRPNRADYRAALRSVLQVSSDEELGFTSRSTWTPMGRADPEPSRAGRPTLDLLAPDRDDDLPRVVSPEHVAEILSVADLFEHWDNSHGGALAREIADDRLRAKARLLDVTCPLGLTSDLSTAMAHLAGVVAFMLFDAYAHDAARRRFTFALQCNDIGGDWHQRATLYANMARQEIWCERGDDGLTYTEMGLVRADRLTATERAMLHTVRARALAKMGPLRAQDALRAVGMADEEFSHSKPEEDPPWMRFYDAAQHRGDTAHALFDVATRSELGTEAFGRFQYSVEHHEPEFARSRAISGTKLATLTMAKGDPREAAAAGQRALDDAGTVNSRRAADDLRELHRLAGEHTAIPEVAELRARIATTVGVAA
ncbi:hypothetical protein [Actinoplanes regularis]|uniref:hypothetical protein n=1 Tax=Actinoplanes regularis TaxID=52697 RepID=UPI0024A50678|nr:hypothetical protein [Actinoplanes regularis]GLW35240.1 hypothetical protein Areg01_81760 [Actinoplanes regularis]